MRQKGIATRSLMRRDTDQLRWHELYAISCFGDRRDAPPQAVETSWYQRRRAEIVERVRKVCAEGRQVYWVCPLIEESEKLELQTAVALHAELTATLTELQVGLLHGRMKPDEKAATMAAFVRGDVQVLVATTVIEVGVDVPNASMMVIEHAERFGLAQLHQLRGRVDAAPTRALRIAVLEPCRRWQVAQCLREQRGFETRGRFLIAVGNPRRPPSACRSASRSRARLKMIERRATPRRRCGGSRAAQAIWARWSAEVHQHECWIAPSVGRLRARRALIAGRAGSAARSQMRARAARFRLTPSARAIATFARPCGGHLRRAEASDSSDLTLPGSSSPTPMRV